MDACHGVLCREKQVTDARPDVVHLIVGQGKVESQNIPNTARECSKPLASPRSLRNNAGNKLGDNVNEPGHHRVGETGK